MPTAAVRLKSEPPACACLEQVDARSKYLAATAVLSADVAGVGCVVCGRCGVCVRVYMARVVCVRVCMVVRGWNLACVRVRVRVRVRARSVCVRPSVRVCVRVAVYVRSNVRVECVYSVCVCVACVCGVCVCCGHRCWSG